MTPTVLPNGSIVYLSPSEKEAVRHFDSLLFVAEYLDLISAATSDAVDVGYLETVSLRLVKYRPPLRGPPPDRIKK